MKLSILSYFSERRIQLLLAVLTIVFVGYFIYVPFLRHNNYFSLRLDLGNMDQTVWNVIHGNGFTLTDPMGTIQESRLAVHADFLLIFLAPLYLIWSDPRMLIIIQTIVLAIGIIPLYLIARKVLGNYYIAFLFAVGYLLYPTIQLNTLHDFHATSITTTLLLFSYWFYLTENPIWFLITAVFAAFGKEQFWIVASILGILWIFKPKYRIFGIFVSVLSSFICYVLFWKIIPAVTPAKQYWALTYLSEYGGSINEILKNIVKQPLQMIGSVIAPDRLYYYYQLLIPTAFLSLFSPLTLVFALPNLGINVLSNNPMMRQIDYQYTSGITPWIFISSIYGYSKVVEILAKFKKTKKYMYQIVTLGLCTALFFSVRQWGELPFSIHNRLWLFTTIQSEKWVMDKVIHSIPSNFSVSATNNIGAHLSQRKYLYNYPINASASDYVLVKMGDQYAWPSGEEQQRVLQSLLRDRNYQLFAQYGYFFAFRRVSI